MDSPPPSCADAQQAAPDAEAPIRPLAETLPSDTPPDAAGPTWHLSLSYAGSAYHGWQIQSGVRTVQGELQGRLRRLFQCPDLRVSGTSRTDAGVHALDQQASFAAPAAGPAFDPAELRRLLNRWLPDDIRVTAVRLAPPGFHARHRAWGKSYTYTLVTAPDCSPFQLPFVWHRPLRLDLEAMRRAAAELEGEHDFASFAANPRRELESTVCALLRVELMADGPRLYAVFTGRRFLYKMVRTLTGFLVKVGQGGVRPEQTPALLQARCRAAVPVDTAPAQGLFLARVFFEPGEWETYRPLLPPFAWEMPAAEAAAPPAP